MKRELGILGYGLRSHDLLTPNEDRQREVSRLILEAKSDTEMECTFWVQGTRYTVAETLYEVLSNVLHHGKVEKDWKRSKMAAKELINDNLPLKRARDASQTGGCYVFRVHSHLKYIRKRNYLTK